MKETSLTIICVAQPSWDGPYAKSTVLLMKKLARHHRVLYVDYAFTLADLLNFVWKKNFQKAKQMLGLNNRVKIDSETSSLAILTLPPMLPINFLPHGIFYRWLNRLNAFSATLAIRKAMKQLQMDRPVVINAFAPGLGCGLVRKLNESKTIYYCYDEITQARWSKKHGGEMEKIFAQKVDAIVVSSEALQEEKKKLNANCFVVKNGVDTEVFKNGVSAKNKIPVIGFVGSLDSRIDYSLLDSLIMRSPEFIFRFVGQVVDNQFHLLKTWKNVDWIPPVSYQELPKYVEQFDVGIIPFVQSEFTKKIYPLKINEYLAMGKPVVMTSFAALSEFDDIVERADEPILFKRKIVDLLLAESEAKRELRKIFAARNSWAVRADEFEKIIKRLM